MKLVSSLGGAAALTLDNAGNGGITVSWNGTTELTTCVVSITPTQSGALSASTIYFYDYEIASVSEEKTLLSGRFALTAQVS